MRMLQLSICLHMPQRDDSHWLIPEQWHKLLLRSKHCWLASKLNGNDWGRMHNMVCKARA